MKRLMWLVLLLAVVGLVAFFVSGKSGLITNLPSVPKTESRYAKLAANILDWITVQRDNLGLYLMLRACNVNAEGKGTCDGVLSVRDSAHSILPAMWGRFLYDKKIKGVVSKEVEENINDFHSYITNHYIQTDLWSCKYFYEMSQSGLFSQDQVQKLEDMCFKYTGYQPIEKITYYRGGADPRIIRFTVSEAAPDFSSNMSKLGSFDVASVVRNFPGMMSAYPSDFVARYLWRKNENDLKAAELYFWEAANYYASSGSVFPQEAKCSLGMSALDLNRATSNSDYLEYSNKILIDLASDREVFSPVCGIWLQGLSKVSNSEKIGSMIGALSGRIERSDLDTSRVLNDGVYLTPGEDGGVGLVKSVRDNGLVVAFFANLI